MMKSLGATFFPPKLNEFQFGDFYCFSLPLFLTVIVLIDFRTNSFLKYRLIKSLKMHLHWRSVIVKTPPVTYVERTNKSYFYGICLKLIYNGEVSMARKPATVIVLVEASLAQARTNRFVSVCFWSSQ